MADCPVNRHKMQVPDQALHNVSRSLMSSVRDSAGNAPLELIEEKEVAERVVEQLPPALWSTWLLELAVPSLLLSTVPIGDRAVP